MELQLIAMDDFTLWRKLPCQHYKTKWQAAWSKKSPCISQVEYRAKCSVCCPSFSIEHQGERDILRHLVGSDHKWRSKDLENVNRIDNRFQLKDQDGAQVWHEELDSTKVVKPFTLGSLA